MLETETIAAFATPYGVSGVGILRISGPTVLEIAKILLGQLPYPRQAKYLSFLAEDGSVLDQGIAIFFPKPTSFTGEDILELHGHGNPIILNSLLQRVLLLPNVRIARPGEFSERAFLNNKLDLIQAESIADLINANSVQASRAAINSLQGVLSKHIYSIVEKITILRINIEASIEFSTEDIEVISNDKIQNDLNVIIDAIELLNNKAQQGNLFHKGLKIVIAGQPNVGKSSLLNVLADDDIAIVTAIAGTTRDILSQSIHIDGVPLCIIDTAGLHNTNNEIELIGIKRAQKEIKQADHIFLVIDNLENNQNITELVFLILGPLLPSKIPMTIVYNKCDLVNRKVGIDEIDGYKVITISAKFNLGIDILRKYLKQSIGLIDSTENIFLARARHLDALKVTSMYLNTVKEQFLINTPAVDIIAEYLRMAQESLNEITGKSTSQDLINKIFSSFCIGK